MNVTIQIFAKAPIPCRVKTRLGKSIGYIQATRLYRQMLEQTLDMASSVAGAKVELWCAPNTAHLFFQECARAWSVTLHSQTQGDLGARMHHASRAGLRHADAVILIGGDCVSLGQAHIQQTIEHLNAGCDAVLGPAEDGGYVLLALKKAPARIFRAIKWSTATVASVTRTRLRQTGFCWAELAVLWDLDRLGDLRRWRRIKK